MLKHEVRPPECIASAPIRTAVSVQIAAPPEAERASLADHESWPQWFALLDRVEVTGAPAGVGGVRRAWAASAGWPFSGPRGSARSWTGVRPDVVGSVSLAHLEIRGDLGVLESGGEAQWIVELHILENP